jgi:predicted transposase YdaD
VVLLPPSDDTEIESVFELENTRHRFQVIKLWQQDPEEFLQDSILLPFATLAQTQNSAVLLTRVAQKVGEIGELQEQQEVSAYVQLMAGLKYDKDEIRRIFREGIMRESVIYQEILQEGEAIGRREGVAIGRQEGVAIGRQEGEQLGIERVALHMLLKGMSVETIAELTGLTADQIQRLQSQMKSG